SSLRPRRPLSSSRTLQATPSASSSASRPPREPTVESPTPLSPAPDPTPSRAPAAPRGETPLPRSPSVPEPEPIPEPPAPVERVRRPVGAFRGGLIGFLLGLSAVGSYGYFMLLHDYGEASRTLLDSVAELKRSTDKVRRGPRWLSLSLCRPQSTTASLFFMTSHLRRIESVESTLSSLSSSAATKAELASLRDEYRKLFETEHLDALNLKAHVWGIEQDLHKLTKTQNTSVRI
ncbi:SPOSA6832_02754, partial [Sporobolomyces salmonicolor]